MATAKEVEDLRVLCKKDLFTFAQVMNPKRLYGDVHKELCSWLTRPKARANQLALIPRAHQKSHIIAVYVAWYITNHPEATCLYISATTNLAEKQLYAIKNIMTSKPYMLLFPDMINKEEGKREKWSATEIAVDHPIRKSEGIRDMTIVACGLTTNTTGLHADLVIADDVVVPDNAYTEEGRTKVSSAMSQISSIKNAGGLLKAVGTRYHPRDQYNTWKAQKVKIFDEEGNEVSSEPLWEIMERVVEENGEFLWPREMRPDGKWFGFNRQVLAIIEAEYTDRTQFFAQYYNDPNNSEDNPIKRSFFQYYNPKRLKYIDGRWNYNDSPLNVYASIDFAYTKGFKSDYTAIAVVGIDYDGNIYVLDLDRFRTDSIAEYFKHVAELHSNWQFNKLRAEVTAAQSIIVRDLKDYITREGMRLSIEEFRPKGKKEERIGAVLNHRYENLGVYHNRGGYTTALEEELLMARPPHDDLKDALASAVEVCIKPMRRQSFLVNNNNTVKYNSRFGGTI